MLNSLAFRLFATAAAWTLLVLPIAGFIIYSLYRDDVQASFDGATAEARQRHHCPTASSTAQEPPAPPRTSASRCSRSRIRAGTGRSSRSTIANGAQARLRLARNASLPSAAERAERRARRVAGALDEPQGPARASRCASLRSSTRSGTSPTSAALFHHRRRPCGDWLDHSSPTSATG